MWYGCGSGNDITEALPTQVSIPHFWVPNAGAISFRVKSRSEVYPRKLSSWSEAWGLGERVGRGLAVSHLWPCPPELSPAHSS